MSEPLSRYEQARNAACEWCASGGKGAVVTVSGIRWHGGEPIDFSDDGYPCTAPDLSTWAEQQAARVEELERTFAAHIRLHDEEVARLVNERDGLARRLKGVTLCDCVTLNFCGPIKPKMLRRLCEHDLFADAACACGGTGVRVPA